MFNGHKKESEIYVKQWKINCNCCSTQGASARLLGGNGFESRQKKHVIATNVPTYALLECVALIVGVSGMPWAKSGAFH